MISRSIDVYPWLNSLIKDPLVGGADHADPYYLSE